MHRRTLRWVATGLLLAAPAAGAQDHGRPSGESSRAAGSPLTLHDAVALALAANPDIAAARAAAAAARLRPAVERTLEPPTVEAQVFQWPLDTPNPAAAQVMVTLEQALPGRGKRALRAQQAEREADVAQSLVATRAWQVENDVKETYIELLRARQLLDLYSSSVELTDQISAAAEARYASGKVSQQDVVRALVERTRLEEQVVMTREQARMAEGTLNVLMGRDPGTPIGPLATVDDPALPPVAVLHELARARQPQLRTPQLETAAAEAALDVAAAERRPDYAVSGGYMRMPNDTDAWTASVSLSWPTAPWTRRRLDAVRREAEARRDAARAMTAAVANDISHAVHEASVRAEAADERLSLLQTALLPRAEHSLELARLNYQTDRASFLDVIDATRLTIDLAREIAIARATRRLAVVALERAVGAELPGPAVRTSARGAAFRAGAAAEQKEIR